MDDTFFETIPGQPHTTLHSRVWNHPGAIVDVGCAGYDWCKVFIGKKRIIGLDPDLSVPKVPGVELMQTQLGPFNGIVSFQGATNFNLEDVPALPLFPMWSWKRFAKAAIGPAGVAALKLNIEGSEWPLLASMGVSDFECIDQLAISFHDFAWPDMAGVSKALISYLESLGYHSKEIYKPLGWWLFWKQT